MPLRMTPGSLSGLCSWDIIVLLFSIRELPWVVRVDFLIMRDEVWVKRVGGYCTL